MASSFVMNSNETVLNAIPYFRHILYWLRPSTASQFLPAITAVHFVHFQNKLSVYQPSGSHSEKVYSENAHFAQSADTEYVPHRLSTNSPCFFVFGTLADLIHERMLSFRAIIVILAPGDISVIQIAATHNCVTLFRI